MPGNGRKLLAIGTPGDSGRPAHRVDRMRRSGQRSAYRFGRVAHGGSAPFRAGTRQIRRCAGSVPRLYFVACGIAGLGVLKAVCSTSLHARWPRHGLRPDRRRRELPDRYERICARESELFWLPRPDGPSRSGGRLRRPDRAGRSDHSGVVGRRGLVHRVRTGCRWAGRSAKSFRLFMWCFEGWGAGPGGSGVGVGRS